MAEKDISNIHTLICNPAAFRLAGDDPDQSCFGALLKAIEPWDAPDLPKRLANAFGAIDLLGKRQFVSLYGLDLPERFADDGNWEELGVPMALAGDYLEFRVTWPCLLACCNRRSSGAGVIKVEIQAEAETA